MHFQAFYSDQYFPQTWLDQFSLDKLGLNVTTFSHKAYNHPWPQPAVARLVQGEIPYEVLLPKLSQDPLKTHLQPQPHFSQE